MDKMLKKVMVVKNSILFNNFKRFEWFSSELWFEKTILDNYEFMIRGEAEINFEYKQAITYAAVVEEWTNKVFVFKRWWSSSNAWESRLFNKIAIWVWWHIDPLDEISKDNILIDSLKREVEEELDIKESDIVSIEAAWFINDDSNEVNSVHFWVFYKVNVRISIVSLNDWELDNWEFIEISEIEKMFNSWDYDVETWSQIVFKELNK